MLNSIKLYAKRFINLFQSEAHLGHLEAKYRETVFDADIDLLRIVMLIYISIIITYGLIDYRVFGLTIVYLLLLAIRMIVMSITIMLMIVVNSIKDYHVRDRCIFIWGICIIVLALWVNLVRPKNFTSNAPIDLIIVFCFYVVIPNKYLYRVFIAGMLTCIQLYIFIFYRSEIEQIGLYSIVVAFLIINVLGIIIANRLYTYRRSLFLSQYEEYVMRIQLERLAQTDFLTGVPNRRYFFELAEQLFATFQRHQQAWCLLMLDIDYFKSINDTFGHATGDEVLKCTCIMIQEQLDDTSVLGRLGGEEFGILADQLNLEHGVKLANAILTSCRNSAIHYAGNTINYTLSIGVTQICPDDLSFDMIYQRADKALYLAKTQGRNRIEILNPC